MLSDQQLQVPEVSDLNKLREKFKNLNNKQKAEVVAASIVSVLFIVSIPVYAWFAFSNKIETLAKVKEPEALDIRAGGIAEPDNIINFDLRDIDIEKMKEEKKPCDFVFSVNAGDYKIPYHLQLAYTTNIPLKYSIYRAKRVTPENENVSAYVQYHPKSDPSEISYYQKETEPLTLTCLNPDTSNDNYYGRTLGKKDYTDYYYGKTYNTASDRPEIYAVPLYWKTKDPISPLTLNQDHDFFVLEINWAGVESNTNFDKWNQAENNKETDLIYITAVIATQ